MWENIGWADAVGVLGTGLVVAAYFATQMRYLNSEDLRFPLINLLGSCLIAVSLWHHFNLASALMEGFWILISLLGIYKALEARGKR